MNAYVDDYLCLPNDSLLAPLSSPPQQLLHLKIEQLLDGTENVSNIQNVSSASPTALDKQTKSHVEMPTDHLRMQQISEGNQFNINGACQTSTGSCDGSLSSTTPRSMDSISPTIDFPFPNEQTESLWYTSAKYFENLDLPDELLSDLSDNSAVSKQSAHNSNDGLGEQHASTSSGPTECDSNNAIPKMKIVMNPIPKSSFVIPPSSSSLKKSAKSAKTSKSTKSTKSKKSTKEPKLASAPPLGSVSLSLAEEQIQPDKSPKLNKPMQQSSMYAYVNKVSLNDKFDKTRRHIQSMQDQQIKATKQCSTEIPSTKRKATTPPDHQKSLKKFKNESSIIVCLKNINPIVYANNPDYNTECVLCGVKVTRCVQHYTKCHPGSEVFISRLSPDMIKAMTQDHQIGEKRARDNVCPFCENYNRFGQRQWISHFAGHMGLKLYKCTNCGDKFNSRSVHLKTCTDAAIQEMVTPEIDGNSIAAYACQLCNYVQFLQQSIVQHLRNEHELINDRLILRNVLKIWLLPKDNKTFGKRSAAVESNPSAIFTGTESDGRITASPPAELDPPIVAAPAAPANEIDDYQHDGLMPDMPEVSDEPPKNIRKCVYYANATYRMNCILCQVQTDDLLAHHRECHADQEYYISRISDTMLILCNFENHQSISMPNGAHKSLCVFCELDLTMYKLSWMEHFAQHTSEYLYACTACNTNFTTYSELFTHTECNASHQTQLIRDQLEETGVRAFYCKLCNFIQFSSQRIVAHLKEHHGKNENDTNFNSLCAKTMISDLDLRNVGLLNVDAHLNPRNVRKAINLRRSSRRLSTNIVPMPSTTNEYSVINVSVADESVVLTDFNITLPGECNIGAEVEIEANESVKNMDRELDTQTDEISEKETDDETDEDHDTDTGVAELPKRIDTEGIILDETPRNNCATVCYSNPVYRRNCVLCRASTRFLARHFNTCHPGAEYYISRISAHMIERLRQEGLPKAIQIKKNNLSGFCPFCETFVRGIESRWMSHLAMHTNEAVYECRNCCTTFRQKSQHLSNRPCLPNDVQQILHFTVQDHFILAHICKICNFVQITEQRILAHLFCHHDIIDPAEINENCMQIKLFNMNVDATAAGDSKGAKKIIQNNNIHMYPGNDKYRSHCVLCNDQLPHNYAKHYLQKHATENYLSRLSPKQMKLAMSQTPTSTRFNNDLSTLCLFCEREQSMPKDKWLLHLSEHTGEFVFKCTACQTLESIKMTDCCDASNVMQIYNFQMTSNSRMYGYSCKICNYVQLCEQNILYHLEMHHGTRKRSYRKHYCRIMVLDLNEDVDDCLADSCRTKVADSADKWLPLFKKFDIKSCSVLIDRYVPPKPVENIVFADGDDGSVTVNSVGSQIDSPNDFLGFTDVSNEESSSNNDVNMEDNSGAIVTSEQPEILAIPNDKTDNVETVESQYAVHQMDIKSEPINTAVNTSGHANDYAFNDKADKTDANTQANRSSNITNQAPEVFDILADSEDEAPNVQHGHPNEEMPIKSGPVNLLSNQIIEILDDSEDEAPNVPHGHPKEGMPIKSEPANLSSNHIIEILDDSDDEAPSVQHDYSSNKIAIKSEPTDIPFNQYLPKNVPIKPEAMGHSVVSAASVKPWTNTLSIKSSNAINWMLTDVALFALFKCMGHNCTFTTQSHVQMRKHLECHEKYKSDGGKAAIVKEEHAGTVIDYLECPYCSSCLSSGPLLMAHIIEIHSSSIFQCQYCFYRSVDAYSVILHANKYHKNRESIVLVCKGFKETSLRNELLLLLDMNLDTVDPIVCHEHNRRFYVTDHFISHLQMAHNSSDFNCHLCGRLLSLPQTKTHMNCHNIGDFQCLYCKFSGNLLHKMCTHMSDKHSNKLMMVIVRNYRPDYTPSEIIDSDRDALIILNAADSIHTNSVRFRELELNEERLYASDPKIITNMYTADNLKDRSMDSHLPPSPMLQAILANYTLRFSQNQILSLKDFSNNFANAHFDQYYKLLEEVEPHCNSFSV